MSIYSVMQVAGMILVLWGFVGDSREQEHQKQKVSSAAVAVTVYLKWDRPLPPYFELGSGASLSFTKGDQRILLLRSTSFNLRAETRGEVTAQAFLDTNSTTAEISGTLKSFREAQEIQIQFPPVAGIPDNTKLLRGEMQGTVNGNLKFHLDIPPQSVSQRVIIVKDLKDFASRLHTIEK